MWIRDCLPKDLPGTRAIIYGFNTKLVESRSFQFISDLASELVSHLETYGGAQGRIKPTAFLAHSLGGLVLKQALVQLGKTVAKHIRISCVASFFSVFRILV